MIARQLVFYFAFGCTQFVVDTALLVLFTHAQMPIALANPLSRALAAVLGLLLNSSITFRQAGARTRVDRAMVLRYVAMWISMTLLSTLLLSWLSGLKPEGFERGSWIAATKIGVESMLFFASFLISRQWVYRRSPSAPTPQ